MPRKSLIIPQTAEQRLDMVAKLLAAALYRLRNGKQPGRINRLASPKDTKKRFKKPLHSRANGASMELRGGRSRDQNHL